MAQMDPPFIMVSRTFKIRRIRVATALLDI